MQRAQWLFYIVEVYSAALSQYVMGQQLRPCAMLRDKCLLSSLTWSVTASFIALFMFEFGAQAAMESGFTTLSVKAVKEVVSMGKRVSSTSP